ncbi:hypothetical protein QCA50_007926 [Cerrena zonata]|uniref:Calcium uniporter protein n=1 Tax=Cerrena zonata TaxID=2478898 RepID=A0AAW0G710_9APHY
MTKRDHAKALKPSKRCSALLNQGATRSKCNKLIPSGTRCKQHRKDYRRSWITYKHFSQLVILLADSASIPFRVLNTLRTKEEVEMKLSDVERYLTLIRGELAGRESHQHTFIGKGDKGHAAWNDKLRVKEKKTVETVRRLQAKLDMMKENESPQALGVLEALRLSIPVFGALTLWVFVLYGVVQYGTWKYEDGGSVYFWISAVLGIFAVGAIVMCAKKLTRVVKAM